MHNLRDMIYVQRDAWIRAFIYTMSCRQDYWFTWYQDIYVISGIQICIISILLFQFPHTFGNGNVILMAFPINSYGWWLQTYEKDNYTNFSPYQLCTALLFTLSNPFHSLSGPIVIDRNEYCNLSQCDSKASNHFTHQIVVFYNMQPCVTSYTVCTYRHGVVHFILSVFWRWEKAILYQFLTNLI